MIKALKKGKKDFKRHIQIGQFDGWFIACGGYILPLTQETYIR
jgi:hypothetical protein